MSWATTLNDIAASWKVGIAFVVLAAVRYLLTSENAMLANARASFFTLFAGSDPKERDDSPDAEAFQEPAPAERARRSTLEFIDSGLIALVVVFFLIRPFVAQAFFIPSDSMVPTLVQDDRLFVDKLSYRFRMPRRGEIVVFRAPPLASPEEVDFIKRLIALPGDTVELRRGVVYVNGEALEDPYVANRSSDDMPPVKLQPGRVFVMGDNRTNSADSRVWGVRPDEQLEMGRIRGRAVLLFWPFSRVGLLR